MGMEWWFIGILLVFVLLAGAGTLHNHLQQRELAAMEEQYGEDEKLVEEIADYNRLLMQYREQISAMRGEDGTDRILLRQMTGHALLDAVLSVKKEQAEKAGIAFLVECDSMIHWNMDERDTVALWMNLLDNAVESAAKFQNGAIWVFIREENGLLLRIENSRRGVGTGRQNCTGMEHRKEFMEAEKAFGMEDRKEFMEAGRTFGMEGRGAHREPESENAHGIRSLKGSIAAKKQKPLDFETTKKDKKAHGFGLGVVRQLTDRYGGQLRIEEQKDRFLVEIRWNGKG